LAVSALATPEVIERLLIDPEVDVFPLNTILNARGVQMALNHAQPELRSTLYSFAVTGDREITMKYAIDRRDPDAVVICTLITLDIDKNIVGQIDDQIVGGESKVERNIAIPARIAPVSARIAGCRIS
jgi:hypothetical protein